MPKLWGGRFASGTDSSLSKLNCSLPVDCRLFADDIDASKAYAEALVSPGYLTKLECEQIVKSLELVRYEWIEGLISFEETDEDVHTVNERRLIEICGEIGEKLHVGRSRNDQVATDMRLWMRKAINQTAQAIIDVIRAATLTARKNITILMPGYTHLQRAQPILFSHWLLSHAFALFADYSRLEDLFVRTNVLPLGSGALAGSPLIGLDRLFLAKRLGFAKISENSIHAVSDRDFVVEFNSVAALISVHLSRLAEDLILYSSKEFNFVTISEQFSTGSSLMPQKRNPDSLELVRGSAGPVFASLTGILMTIKGLPSSYNKDLQFDKKLVFDAFDLLQSVLDVTKGVLATVKVNQHNCESALSSEMLATDWAYYLVKKGIPFRTAHHLVGKVVVYAENNNFECMEQVPLEVLQSICNKFSSDIKNVSNFKQSINQYCVPGGTSESSVESQLLILEKFILEKSNVHFQ